MSSDWSDCSIGDLGRVITGKTPTTENPANFGGEIPFLTPTDMEDGLKTVSAQRCLTEEGLISVKNCFFERGVAVSCIGWKMGKSVLVERPTVTNQQINTVVVNEDKYSIEYVYYMLSSMRNKIFELGSTATRTPILNKTNFSKIKISVPPLKEQFTISNFLTAFDDRITLLRKTNVTLEAIAQALFRSWFVDFDPVHAKQQGRAPEGVDAQTAALFPDSFEESELGMVPKGWTPARLDSFVELAYGKALKAEARTAGAVPVYGSGGVTGWHNSALVNEPSIVVGRKGTVGSLYWENRPFFPIDTVFYVKTKKPLSYVFQVLKSLGLSDMNTDAAVPGLNRENAYRLLVAGVADAVITAFDEVASSFRKSVVHNSRNIESLEALRDTLLPRLISGQLRLPEAEALVSEVGL